MVDVLQGGYFPRLLIPVQERGTTWKFPSKHISPNPRRFTTKIIPGLKNARSFGGEESVDDPEERSKFYCKFRVSLPRVAHFFSPSTEFSFVARVALLSIKKFSFQRLLLVLHVSSSSSQFSVGEPSTLLEAPLPAESIERVGNSSHLDARFSLERNCQHGEIYHRGTVRCDSLQYLTRFRSRITS